MSDLDFAMETIWNQFTDVEKVNLITGDCIFIKTSNFVPQLKTIKEYVTSENNLAQIYTEDIPKYKEFLEIDNLLSKLKDNNMISFSYRRMLKNEYRWVTFEIIKPVDFSVQNPFVIFARRITDSISSQANSDVDDVCNNFHKILKADLKKDTYKIIKITSDDMPNSFLAKRYLSHWYKEFLEHDNIIDDDIELFKRFSNMNYMRSYFIKNKGNLRIRYRRKYNDKIKWVMFEAVPCADFSIDNQIVTFFVRDITEEYSDELKYKKTIEKICYEDSLTGIQNRNAYSKICLEYNRKETGGFGVIFSDLNYLKYINDKQGHDAGDKYLMDFGILLSQCFTRTSCYRIGGDEFVVIIPVDEEYRFTSSVELFKKTLKKKKNLSVSFGSVWSKCPCNIKKLVTMAEKLMYQDKSAFHKIHPEFERREIFE